MGLQWLKDMGAAAMTKASQYTNANYKNGVMACCALIAASDGEIEKEEKSKVATLIQKSELLAAFPPTELRDLFLSYCEKATDEFERLDLLAHVRKLKGVPDQAEMALGIAVNIANADGEFEDCEKKVVGELAAAMGLPTPSYA